MEVEAEAAEGETPQTETVTFTRYTYTVSFAGDTYFADHVFHLTEEQKELAENYASNSDPLLWRSLRHGYGDQLK